MWEWFGFNDKWRWHLLHVITVYPWKSRKSPKQFVAGFCSDDPWIIRIPNPTSRGKVCLWTSWVYTYIILSAVWRLKKHSYSRVVLKSCHPASCSPGVFFTLAVGFCLMKKNKPRTIWRKTAALTKIRDFLSFFRFWILLVYMSFGCIPRK